MTNPNFNPTYSTWDIWRADEQAQCLDDDLVTIEGDITALETVVANKADIIHTHSNYASTSNLSAHTGNTSNPHKVNLSQLGVTATAAELNKMDGVTATTTELNYVDGVTSAIQDQLNGKAASSHNHSASNITSGTLSVARGGTGSSVYKTDVTISRGKDTGTESSDYGYTCQYIPYLNMCFFRLYAQPKATFDADTEYEVATVASATYYPESMMALSNYCQKEITAYINTEGQVVVRPHESVGTSYGIRLAGYWFCE